MNIKLINDTLNTMTRGELRAVARKLGVQTGKDKAHTLANLVTAIDTKKARFTLQFTIRPNTDPEARFVPGIFSRKLRTHKADKTLIAIESEDKTPAPVAA